MGKFFRKLVVIGSLFGAGYLLFTKKGQRIQLEIRQQLPTLLAEVKVRYGSGKKALDDVIDEVVDEWEGARKLMRETIAPLKREIKKRMGKK